MKHPPSHWGLYSGRVVAEWLDSDYEDRRMRLVEGTTLRFIDPAGVVWIADVGLEFDGASIPPVLWILIGSPFTGKYRKAAVLHDSACKRRDRPYYAAHWMMYMAMRAKGVGHFRAYCMFKLLLWFGSKW